MGFLVPYSFKAVYFDGPYILPHYLTLVFQKTVKRVTRTIINGGGAFTLHVYPDGFWL